MNLNCDAFKFSALEYVNYKKSGKQKYVSPIQMIIG